MVVVATAFAAVGCGGGDFGYAPLGRDQRGVTSMVADEGYVYWTVFSGALRRVSIDGGPVETVVDDITNPGHVAVDGGHVYWTMGQGVVARAPKAGGSVELLSENEQDPVGLRVDDDNVYWARQDGFVRRVPKAGGERVTLAKDSGKVLALADSGVSLLWVQQEPAAGEEPAAGAVRQVSSSGGDAATLALAPAPRAVAANGTDVLWASLDPDALALDPKSNAMRISRAVLDGSDERVVARELHDVDALVADDTQVYFSTLEGDLSFVSLLDGGSPTSFASGPSGRTSIAVDRTSIYWAHADGDAVFVYPKQQAVVVE